MTSHVFVVDVTTFKYHLEYQFVGTGMRDIVIDFNYSKNTDHSSQTENAILGLIADFFRVRVGDLVFFYLQQNKQDKIFEGKFYGIFKIKSTVFLDNNDNQQFLKDELGKSLTFRCLIEPCEVFAQGVSEWEALDEIKNIQTPNQMLWSLIYRKLKGNRGNTMITMHESLYLRDLIAQKNNYIPLQVNSQIYSFNINTQEIISLNQGNQVLDYAGRVESINILPRLIYKFEKHLQFETHLQAFILQNFEVILHKILASDSNLKYIEWLGNEVSCGVGMQRIDIMTSIILEKYGYFYRGIIPIELKSCEVSSGILSQMQRYIDWLIQYYIQNNVNFFYDNFRVIYYIQPMIICRETHNKNCPEYKKFCEEVSKFNCRNNMQLIYVEFNINDNLIDFKRVF